MQTIVIALSIASFAYFVVLNGTYLLLTAIAWPSVTGHLRARRHAGIDEAFASPLTPPVSILLPAYNEETGIVDSVRSLLALRYPVFEIVVINDGSTDGTLSRLHEAFDLVPVRKVVRDAVPSRPVHAAYASRRHPELLVIEKENGGGKADAVNAGVDVARFPYVCAIDADAVIEEDALIRVAKPFLDDPDVVAAAGGVVRIINGCEVDHGRVTRVGLPKSRLATLQVLEYFRAFLVGRVAWSRLNALLIISGAFGLFRRSLVEAVGGYSTTTVGEDIDIVLRLHTYLRERGEPYRIVFVPDPVCWTEAPESLRGLSRQRRRWQRGLAEASWTHRRAIGNPRYGLLGLFAFPYFVVFELLGPVFALLGLPVTLVAWAYGWLSADYVGAFIAVSFLFGILLSVAALALEEFSFRRHPSGREVARMLWYAVVENVGYRQINQFWQLQAFADLARGRRGWGRPARRGFGLAHATPAVDLTLPPTLAAPSPAAFPEARPSIDRLEQLVAEHADAHPDRAEEWRYTLLSLRGYADVDGRLPGSLDRVVNEVFGDLLGPAPMAA
jgi:cellulose synthase/poly-beta-1,6-N-acetylglucosamine synthase-like glycosyltransferase